MEDSAGSRAALPFRAMSYSPLSGRDIVAGAESAAKEAELERDAERYSQLHPDDESRADTPTGLRKALKRLRRILPSRG